MPRGSDRSLLASLALVAIAALGADAPEVRRVKVPASKVVSLFPPGSELRSMPLAEFEALVRRAGDRSAAPAAEGPPRLLRARHWATLEGDVLRGRSEFTADRPIARPSALRLEPWSPAVLPTPGTTGPIRSLPDGSTALWVEPGGPPDLLVDWEARSRPGSGGRGFSVGLPRIDVSSMTLDLPADLVPDGPPGLREGPAPGSAPGRRSWRFGGPGGPVAIRLLRPTAPAEGEPRPGPFVGGPTRIEVDEATARWRADWFVDPGREGRRRFLVELDPGLIVLDVRGPAVASYRQEPEGRLAIRLSDEATGPTLVSIRALTRVEAEGRWEIPAARPIDVIWTGGRTSVRVGPSRTIEDVSDPAGNRVAPRAEDFEGEERGGRLLVFDPGVPRSVAALAFRRPSADCAVEVRGRLALDRGPARFEASLAWEVARGPLLAIDLEVSPGWDVEGLKLAGSDRALAWDVEARADGSKIVRVQPPEPAEIDAGPRLLIEATAEFPGRAGPVPLPRVRPAPADPGEPRDARVRVVEESWAALAAPGIELRPRSARGLAWVEPSTAAPWTPGSSSSLPQGLREAIAWRWVDPVGEGEIEREREAPRPEVEAWTLAQIGPKALRLDWFLKTGRDAPPIPAAIDGEPGEAPTWTVLGDETGPSPTAPANLAGLFHLLGLRSGTSASILLPDPRPGRGPAILHASREGPWTGSARLPRLGLPRSLRGDSRLLVRVDPAWLASFGPTEGRALDPAMTRAAFDRAVPGFAVETAGRWFAFSDDEPRDPIEVRTVPLVPSSAEGVIEEATLTTLTSIGAPALNRLDLRIASASGDRLGLRLADGATLETVRVDGLGSVPSLDRETYLISLSRPDGPRARSVSLTYRGPLGGENLRPGRPWLSFPCLSFRWSLELPPTIAARAVGPGIFDSDPPPIGPRANPFAGFDPLRPRAEPAPSRLNLGRRPIPASLGDLLALWDSGDRPIVVDRDALGPRNLGPGSAIPGSGKSNSTAAEILGPLGLSAIPIGKGVLVTAASEAPDRPGGTLGRPGGPEAFGEAIEAAIASGSDPSGRFESAPRWLEDPRSTSLEGPIGPDPTSSSLRRFASPGWPARGQLVRVEETRSRAARGYGSALATLFVGIAFWSRKALFRWSILGAIAASSVVLVAWPTRDFPIEASGVLVGIGVLIALRVGRSLRSVRAETLDSHRSHGSRRPRRPWRIGRAAGPVGLLIVSAGAADLLAQELPGARPIVALIPYEGAVEPDGPGDRVVILLEDFERLRRLAEPPAEIRVQEVAAVGAEHVLGGESMGGRVVESRYRIVSEGPGDWSWSIPLGGSRDLSAEVDGRPVPVRIGPEVKEAILEGSGPGPHDCVVRRVVAPTSRDGLGLISLPINPVASARVRAPSADPGSAPTIPTARGKIVDGEGALGPVDRLEIVLPGPPAPAAVEPSGEVAGQILWDLEPAGDRLRARFVVDRPEGLSSLRVRVDPDLAIRSARAPGLVDAVATASEWVARFTPRLARGEVLELDAWRPLAPTASNEIPPETGPARELPRLEPIGSGRDPIRIGLRRPDGWSGRLSAAPGAPAVDDPEFARDWGAFPDASLAFAGAIRAEGNPGRVRVAAGPAPSRRSIRPGVLVEVQPGRLVVEAEARLEDRAGFSHGLVAQIAPDLRISRVEADGLTDWSRPSPDRLRLRFDGDATGPRTIRIEGWVPTTVDPLSTGDRPLSLAVPWPTWPGSAVEPGLLRIEAPPACSASLIEPAAGVTPLPREPASRGRLERRSYRVERPEGPGRLRWIEEPANLSVKVRELLTVEPDSVRWLVKARFSSTRGPCRAVRFRVPADWSEGLRVEAGGATAKVEPRGDSRDWTLEFRSPFWGAKEVVLRADRPTRGSGPIAYPELTPLGRGDSETLLAIDDASGREPVLRAGSPGIQEVDPARFDAEAFPIAPGVRRSVYRVAAPGWSLQVQPGADSRGGDDSTVPASADVVLSMAQDGSIVGVSRFDLAANPGPHLALSFPKGIEPAAADVDGRATRPVVVEGGTRVLVPLRDRASRRVTIAWTAAASKAGIGGFRTLTIPEPAAAGVATLIEMHLPAGSKLISARDFGIALSDPALLVERVERLGKEVAAAGIGFDYGSGRDRARLLGSLVGFDRLARAADRSIRLAPLGFREPGSPRPPETPEERRNASIRLLMARGSVADFLRDVGLEGLGAEAASIAAGERGSLGPIEERSEAIRPPRVGVSRAFLGKSSGDARPRLAVSISAAPTGAVGRVDATARLIGVLGLVGLTLPLAGPGRRSRRLGLGLLMILGLAAGATSVWVALAWGLAFLGGLASGFVRPS